MWSMHLCNWKLRDRPGGSAYTLKDLGAERLQVAYQWLAPPASSQLERFSLSFVEMEARGGEAVRLLVDAIRAAAREELHEAAYRLELLDHAILEMAKAFSANIRNAHVDPRTWLELVQPTFAWGADGDDGQPLPGPNGMQMPSIHCLDAGLGLPGESLLARQSRGAREQMPRSHRRFLAAMDAARGLLRGCIEKAGTLLLRRRYNDCVRTLAKFRVSHRARGGHYLDAGRYGSSGRISTGMGMQWRPPGGAELGTAHVIPVATGEGNADPVAEFDRRMSERIAELEGALLAGDGRADAPTVENTFRFLTAAERAQLLGGAPRRTFRKGEPIIRQGEKLQSFFVIEEGFVRIEKHGPTGTLVLARLWPGEVFGELSFLAQTEASAWAIADEEVEVRVLERSRMYDLAATSSEFSMRFYESLAVLVASRLRDANALLEALSAAPRAQATSAGGSREAGR